MSNTINGASGLSIPQLLSDLSDFTRDQLMEDIKEVSSLTTQREMLETAYVKEMTGN